MCQLTDDGVFIDASAHTVAIVITATAVAIATAAIIARRHTALLGSLGDISTGRKTTTMQHLPCVETSVTTAQGTPHICPSITLKLVGGGEPGPSNAETLPAQRQSSTAQ